MLFFLACFVIQSPKSNNCGAKFAQHREKAAKRLLSKSAHPVHQTDQNLMAVACWHRAAPPMHLMASPPF